TSAASVDKPWMRILLLSPSISNSASVTMLGNEDLTLMRKFFVKPQTVIKIGFSDDPMMGMASDHFSGSTNVKLKTVSLAEHSAALQRIRIARLSITRVTGLSPQTRLRPKACPAPACRSRGWSLAPGARWDPACAGGRWRAAP